MIKFVKILTLTIIGTIAFNATQCVMAAQSLPSGWYVEGNFGYSKLHQKNYPGSVSVKSKGAGFNVSGGYKFTSLLAAELGYTRYANVKITGPVGIGNTQDRFYSYNLAGKLIWPISISCLNFELFTKLGATRLASSLGGNFASGTSSKSNKYKWGYYFGVGAGYIFTPSLSLTLQGNRAATTDRNQTGSIDLYSLGLTYIIDWGCGPSFSIC